MLPRNRPLYDKEQLLYYLHLLDDRIQSPYSISLCGSAAIILQGENFRRTCDIDFTVNPDAYLSRIIDFILKQNPDLYEKTYDRQAAGVVCLLEDYEDRLVEIFDNFKYLRVYVLSIEDWIVTKLEAPKFTDLYEYPHFLTRERLQFIEDHMHLYCGLKEDYARQSLKLLWEELESIESRTEREEFPDNNIFQ